MSKIKSLISDSILFERAKLLHKAEAWCFAGMQGDLAFGEIYNGLNIPHNLAWHFKENWWKCSCPYHARPCVHLIALALDFESGKLEEHHSLPSWLQSIQSTSNIPQEPILLKQKKRTEESIKRRVTRKQKAKLGLLELETWLIDLVRRGIASTLSEGADWNEAFASRMADASMNTLSRRIRLFGENTSLEKLPNQLGALWLAKQAFEREDALEDALFSDLMTFLGAKDARKKDIFAEETPIKDAWLVMGSIVLQVEDSLKERRTWLFGHKSKQYALLRDFSFGPAEFPVALRPQSIIDCNLYFYPSGFPQRALHGEEYTIMQQSIEQAEFFNKLSDLRMAYSKAIGQNPWLLQFPVFLKNMTPIRDKKGRFFIQDEEGDAIPLSDDADTNWSVLAHSGGNAIEVFGEWGGLNLQILNF